MSGLNVEYRATPFAFILMAEYINIIFMSMLTAILFFRGRVVLIYSGFVMFLVFCLVWARGRLPRIRYDKLISLT